MLLELHVFKVKTHALYLYIQDIRPLQINFLFPVLRPHLLLVSNKFPLFRILALFSGYS